MTTQVLLTTTGTETSFRVPDLGIGFTHPTTDYDLIAEGYRSEVLQYSQSLQEAIDSEIITLKDGLGKTITNIFEYLAPLINGEKESYYGEKSPEVTVSSPEPYQVYQKVFTPEISSASYKISWYAEVTTDNNKLPFRLNVVLDGTEELCDFIDKPVTKNEFIPVSGFAIRTLDDNEHTIDFNINYKTRTSVLIRRIRILIERK